MQRVLGVGAQTEKIQFWTRPILVAVALTKIIAPVIVYYSYHGVIRL